MTEQHITTARIKGAGTRDLETGVYSGTKPKHLNSNHGTAQQAQRVCGYFVSTGKKQFSGKNLQASLGLIVSQGYTHCHIVSTGTLQRWNIMSEHQMTERRAYRVALVRENMWIEECLDTLSSVGNVLSKQVFNGKPMPLAESIEPSDDQILADTQRLKLKCDKYDSEQMTNLSKSNIGQIEIQLQVFSKKITFIIHSWDSIQTNPQFLQQAEQYRHAVSTSPEYKAKFSASRKMTTQNFIRRRKKELYKNTEKTEADAILKQYQINCPMFLDEESPIVAFFLKTLGCEHVYYPGPCIAQFQVAYKFYDINDPKISWKIINFKSITYDPESDPEKIIQLLTVRNPKEISQHADLFKRHLDTIIFSEPFRRFLKNSSLLPAAPDEKPSGPTVTGLLSDTVCEKGNLLPTTTMAGQDTSISPGAPTLLPHTKPPEDAFFHQKQPALSPMCRLLADSFNFKSILSMLQNISVHLSQVPLTHEQKRDLTCESAQLISRIQQAHTPRESGTVSDLFSSNATTSPPLAPGLEAPLFAAIASNSTGPL